MSHKTRSINSRVRNFYKRWKIVYDNDKKFKNFKNRALSTIDNILGKRFLSNPSLEQDFLKLAAKHYPQSKIEHNSILYSVKAVKDYLQQPVVKEFKNSPVYKVISEENNFVEFIKLLQALFWLDLDLEVKEKLFLSFKKDIELSLLDIQIKKIKNDFIFYPKGAELLDEKVVNDVLDWLDSYPKVQESFKSALKKYQDKVYQRNLLDDLRFSFELLLKKILKNKKRLEKQQKPLGKYLEEKNVSKQLRNMYWKLVDCYCEYQNNSVKHDDKVNGLEIEFIIYLTGTFMRFLMTLEDTKNA